MNSVVLALAIRSWTLVAPNGQTSAVEVPAHFHDRLPASRSVYTLATTVDLPPSLRGRALTFDIPLFEGVSTLRANGVEAAPLDGDQVRGERASGPHRWRIDRAQTDSPQLRLELIVQHNLSRSAWLETVPRLGTDPLGDPVYRKIRDINVMGALASVAGVGMITFLYLFLYVYDRQRTLFAWFALQTFAAGLCLFYLGWTQALFGRYDTIFADACLTIACISGMEFVPRYFDVKPPRILQGICVASFVVATLFASGAYRLHIHQRLTMISVVTIITYSLVFLTRMARNQESRADALLLRSGWILLTILGFPDIWALAGFGQLLGGARTSPYGFILYCMFQAVTLGRSHIRTLRDIGVLNESLRRQIAERSRQLSEALARLPIASQRRRAELAPGDVVRGRYRVVRPLGAGGMGAVIEVERLADARHFAMKVVTRAETGADLARFAREAQIAAHVAHENLVSIADVDVSDTGELFLVMELVPGTSVAGCRDRYGDPAWALPILRQVAKGLEALHAGGVVHRDLKPSNVLLSKSLVKIADFGIARIATADEIEHTVDHDAATTRGDSDSDLTGTGKVIGTPLYMAPELAEGSKIAPPSSDIWSFGVMAYEMATARRPFDTPPVMLMLVGEPVPAPPALTLPSATVAQVLMRCLSLRPEERPTASELVSALVPRL
jgi:serine/threonine-protein kinase